MEKTIGDRFKDFYVNYIAPSPDVNVGSKENDIVNPHNQPPDKKDDFFTKKLPMSKCREVAEQCPLFMKGARKKSMDSVRSWHIIDTIDEDTNPVKQDIKLIEDFWQRSNFKAKWYDARVASYVYGDGFLLITFKNDDDTKIYDEPSKEAYPWTVDKINPEYIVDLDFYGKNDEEKNRNRSLGIKHFHLVNFDTGEDKWIHPKRIIHLPSDTLPYSEFGNSKVNLLRNIIKSKINVDIACGEILAWFAHGVFDIGIQNCNENDITRWQEIAKKHPGAWIHDKDREELKAVEPKAIDPKPYYDFLILNIASALVMPVHVLTGIQVGRVTGAEVGTGDYYKDVKDDQDLLYTPLLVNLYKWILKGHNYNSDEKPPLRRWKYKLIWNPVYIDELSEAEILKTKAEAANIAFNGQGMGASGFVDIKEARKMLNKGQITVDIEKKPRPPKKPQPPQPMPKPTKTDDEYYKQLDNATKAMIAKRKELARKERELGEQILKEQKDV